MNNVTATSDAGAGSGPSDTEPRSYFTNLVIRWTFAADINATQAADAQFQSLESALESADGDIRDAMHLMDDQHGKTAIDATNSLQTLSETCADVSKDAKKLRTALSRYASAMGVVRSRFEGFISEASAHGMTVKGDYRNCSLSYEDRPPESHAQYFFDLKPRVDYARSLYNQAEKEFADALDVINPEADTEWIRNAKAYVTSYYIPSSDNPAATSVGPIQAWTSGWATALRGGRSYYHRGNYRPPANLADMSYWKRVTAKGDVFNWSWFGIHSAAGESRLAAPIKGLNTVGAVAGRVFPIVNGTMTGLESLRSDDINHPEMGDGEKVVRAAIKGTFTAGAELIGGGAGAYAGGLVGVPLGGPIGAVIGYVGGGLTGGFLGNESGKFLGDSFNNYIVHPFVKWWNS